MADEHEHARPRPPRHEHDHHEHEHVLAYQDAVAQFRADKDEYFKRAPGSPIPAAEREAFTGLPYYPVDEALLLRGPRRSSRTPATSPSRFQIPTSDGKLRPAHRAGTLALRARWRAAPADRLRVRRGRRRRRCSCRSSTRRAGPRRTAPAATSTSSPRTTGRTSSTSTSRTTRRACTTRVYSCPLTPAENRLPVRVEAGERLPEGYGG